MGKPKYTHEYMIESTKDLLKTRDLSSITIQMICNTAGVGRGTFYRHFTGKYDWWDQLRRIQSEICWDDMIDRYAGMDQYPFGSKMKKLTAYLMAYTRRNEEFRKITKGSLAWRDRFARMIRSDQENQKQFNRELNEYAAKIGKTPEEVRMDVHFLLTRTARYAYDVTEKQIPLSYEEAKDHIGFVSGSIFPETAISK